MAPQPQELYPELWAENNRLKSLVDLGKVLANPQEGLDSKLARCVKTLACLTQAESCSLMLVEDGDLVVKAANRPGLAGLATPLEQASIATQVARSGQAIYAEQVEQSDFAAISRKKGKRSYRTGSLISLPLNEGGQVVGVLNLADKAGEPCFSGQDVATAQGIAQEISGLVNFSALHSRLETAYRELAQAQQAKEDLMHLIFHDMKAPITAVKEVLGMLEPPGGLPARERSQYLAMARGDLELLWRRLTNLLDIKRMDAGRYPLDLMPLNLADLVSETVERLAPLSKFEGVELSFKAHAGPRVISDEDLLERILSNFILNAVKHAGLNKGKGRVSLSVGIEQERARVEVFDNGPGVDPALGEAVFERYVGGAPRKGSTGLGLFFCRRAAEMLGGRVGFRNQEPGAVFYLELPLGEG